MKPNRKITPTIGEITKRIINNNIGIICLKLK